MPQDLDIAFWAACVRFKPFRDHVRAAAAGRFTSMSVSPDAIRPLQEQGVRLADIRRMAEDEGVPIRHFDSLTGWAPMRVPPGAPPEMLARFDVPIEECLELSAELGVRNILAVGAFPEGTFELEELAAGFDDLCKRAAALDMHVNLEFMPILGLRSLAAAWSIVDAVRAPNSGIMIDTWHFSKTGIDLDLLDRIDARFLRTVQVSDGFFDQKGGDILEDLLFHRAFPGEGEFPIVEVLSRLRARGGLVEIGCEVFSHGANEMSASEAGAHSRATLDQAMSAAGF